MDAMFILFMFLVLCGISNGDCKVQCGSGDGLSLAESDDGVDGRYLMEWCTRADGRVGQYIWTLNLRCDTKRKPEGCLQYNVRSPKGVLHSRFEEDIAIELNCTYVCLSTWLDLIFNGTCYTFNTFLKEKPHSLPRWPSSGTHNYVHYVNNKYSEEHFSESQAHLNVQHTGDHVTAEWFLGYVPATKYDMHMCAYDANGPQNCTSINSNCSTPANGAPTTISCKLWPSARVYRLTLDHYAPWSSGDDIFRNIIHISHVSNVSLQPTASSTVSEPANMVLWWVFGGLLVLTLTGGAALMVWRSHFVTKLRKSVESDWRRRTQGEAAAVSQRGPDRRVLLLYARDCAPMMIVAAQLRALLQRSVDHVYDIYSAEVVSEAARAPGEWVRRVVARDDVRVVLLQTPAAACLHAPALAARGAALQLEQPLLNRRVMYRVPHSSDALLPLALRVLADTAYTVHSYKKFYVAAIIGLEAELVREVTPLRRYSLPAAAELLLRDLSDGALEHDVELEAQMQRFSKAVLDLHDYVRLKPDYLDEELIFFHYDT